MNQELFKQYYTTTYKDNLGLADWEERIKCRLSEEKTSQTFIQSRLELFYGSLPTPGGRILVVGGGTGAEFIALQRLGYEAWSIEPDNTACSLAQQKAIDYAMNPTRIIQGVAEHLPFEDSFFDGIWCFTVLEHVQDYRAVLTEVSRVMKKGAWAFFQFPDYRSIYEQHYKLYLPLFLPKWFNAFLLRKKGRNPTYFMKQTNNINARKFLVATRHLPMHVFEYHNPWNDEWKHRRTKKMQVSYWLKNWFNIGHSPSFHLKKID